MLPQDPFMLYSFINMKLRDEYPDLEELCKSFDIDRSELQNKLKVAGFEYDSVRNQFR